MNEKPMMDSSFEASLSQRLREGSLFEQQNESAKDDLADFLSESTDDLALPRLTLRHPDEFEEDVAPEVELELKPELPEPPASSFQAPPIVEADDTWPWNSDIFGAESSASGTQRDDDDEFDLDLPALSPIPRAKFPVREDDSALAVVEESVLRHVALRHAEDDHSAIEDVLLSMPLMHTPIEETLAGYERDSARPSRSDDGSLSNFIRDVSLSEKIDSSVSQTEFRRENPVPAVVIAAAEPETTPPAEPTEVAVQSAAETATAGFSRTAQTPKRIGSGQLVPARLTWKPGDPFGDSNGAGLRRFRWDVMLTSAGITAACGMFCIWILRTLLA